VKRKADTTTPGAPGATIRTSSSPYDTPFDSSPAPVIAKQLPAASVKSDSGVKPNKKFKKDTISDIPAVLFDGRPMSSDDVKLSPALDFCREILKELFGKRHAVCKFVYSCISHFKLDYLKSLLRDINHDC